MEIHVPSGEEVADFLESGEVKRISKSCNFVTHFSELITLKIMRGPSRKIFAHREEETSKFLRSHGVKVPFVFDVTKLRKLEQEKIPKKLEGAGKKPWVVIMEHIHGKALHELKPRKAREMEPRFLEVMHQLKSLPIQMDQEEYWHLSEMILDPDGDIFLLDLEMCKIGKRKGLKKVIKDLRQQYRLLMD